jgi:hypothetical protein
MDGEPDGGWTIEGVSDETFTLINHHHAEHPNEPLTLTGAQVCELAGCAGEEAVRNAAGDGA